MTEDVPLEPIPEPEPPAEPAEPLTAERIREIQERLREDMRKRERKTSMRRNVGG